MKALLEELRLMTGVGTEQYEVDGISHWTDEDLERKILKRVSARLVQAEIELISTINSESALVFLSGEVQFEGTLDTETASVVTAWGGEINGTTTISPGGWIEFSESQIASMPLLIGTAYDLNGAAADVLTDWASAVKLGYDITTDGQTLTRSQRHTQLLEQAEQFRKRAIIGSVRMERRDVRAKQGHRARTEAVEHSFEVWGLNVPKGK